MIIILVRSSPSFQVKMELSEIVNLLAEEILRRLDTRCAQKLSVVRLCCRPLTKWRRLVQVAQYHLDFHKLHFHKVFHTLYHNLEFHKVGSGVVKLHEQIFQKTSLHNISGDMIRLCLLVS